MIKAARGYIAYQRPEVFAPLANRLGLLLDIAGNIATPETYEVRQLTCMP